MGWISYITNAGRGLLRSMFDGAQLTVTRAEIGSDVLSDSEIKVLSSIGNQIPALVQIQKQADAEIPTVEVRINNSGVTETAELHQVGLYAELSDGSEILFAVYQSEFGEEILSETEYPDLNLKFYAKMDISVTDNIAVVVNQSAFVTVETLDERLSAHNSDPAAHADIRELALNTAGAAVEAHNADPAAHGSLLGNISQLEGEVSRLSGEVAEIKLRVDTNITANPFSVTFKTLDGVTVSGVLNTTRGTVDF